MGRGGEPLTHQDLRLFLSLKKAGCAVGGQAVQTLLEAATLLSKPASSFFIFCPSTRTKTFPGSPAPIASSLLSYTV